MIHQSWLMGSAAALNRESKCEDFIWNHRKAQMKSRWRVGASENEWQNAMTNFTLNASLDCSKKKGSRSQISSAWEGTPASRAAGPRSLIISLVSSGAGMRRAQREQRRPCSAAPRGCGWNGSVGECLQPWPGAEACLWCVCERASLSRLQGLRNLRSSNEFTSVDLHWTHRDRFSSRLWFTPAACVFLYFVLFCFILIFFPSSFFFFFLSVLFNFFFPVTAS